MPRPSPRLVIAALMAGLTLLTAACVNLTGPSFGDDGGPGGRDDGLGHDRPGAVDVAPDVPQKMDGDADVDLDAWSPDATPVDGGLVVPDASNLGSGLACGSGDQCASGFCLDGVCCQTECNDPCQACALAGTVGTCSPVPAGADPDDDCAAGDVATCGADGTCNGNGACRLFLSGTSCQPASCTAAIASLARTCDGLGTCRPALTKPCDPYKCEGTTCSTTCGVDSDCQAGSSCQQGTCSGLLQNGAACTGVGQCRSGHCVDGVCCQSACTGACHACNLIESSGVCAPIASGSDPADECAPEAAETCGREGFCDGRGACRLHGVGTECTPAICQANSATPSRTCDGNGVCQIAIPASCNGYVCGATACITACTSNADCVSPNICLGSTCRPPKALGAACVEDAECAAGFCEQGVCCGSACTENCRSCALAGTEGTCTVVPAGQDPSSHCGAADAATCGLDGTCNGAGGCRKYEAGTTCASATCSGSIFSSNRTCDGEGTCLTVTSSDCAPYLCDGSSCRKRCSGNQHCAAGSTCVNNACTSPKKANGEACAATTECLSGFCAQGVCCNASCTGACVTCDLVESLGTCTNVAAGQDPRSQCTDAGVASCGDDGFCNGAGACRKYPLGTICAGAACTNATATPARTCSGSGLCQAVTPVSCGKFQCSGTTCLQQCSSSSDCVAPSICAGGNCGGLKGQYFAGRTFDAGSLRLTRVDGQVNFDWGGGAPSNVPFDNFCARWTGQITPRYSQTYTFYTQSDDGARVWVNGTLVVNHWFDQNVTERTLGPVVTLQAGQAYDIRVEYYDATGAAAAKLLWSSASQAKQIIPTSRLTPAP